MKIAAKHAAIIVIMLIMIFFFLKLFFNVSLNKHNSYKLKKKLKTYKMYITLCTYYYFDIKSLKTDLIFV